MTAGREQDARETLPEVRQLRHELAVTEEIRDRGDLTEWGDGFLSGLAIGAAAVDALLPSPPATTGAGDGYEFARDFPGWDDLTTEQKAHVADIEAGAFWRGYNYDSALICKCGARRDGSVPHNARVHEAYGQPLYGAGGLLGPAAPPEHNHSTTRERCSPGCPSYRATISTPASSPPATDGDAARAALLAAADDIVTRLGPSGGDNALSIRDWLRARAANITETGTP